MLPARMECMPCQPSQLGNTPSSPTVQVYKPASPYNMLPSCMNLA
jgi:hypothetical protein